MGWGSATGTYCIYVKKINHMTAYRLFEGPESEEVAIESVASGGPTPGEMNASIDIRSPVCHISTCKKRFTVYHSPIVKPWMQTNPMSTLPEKTQHVLTTLFKSFARIWLFLAKAIGSLVLFLIMLMLILMITVDTEDGFGNSAKVLIKGGKDKVAVVRLRGEIVALYGSRSGFSINPRVITPAKTKKIFDRLQNDEDIKAVVIQINSPGGSVVPTREIYQQIRDLRKAKPVVASFSEVAASGGYYLGAAANRIIAHPASITGSIGVIAMVPDISGLYEKIGVKINTFKSGQFKDMGSMDRNVTEEEEEIFQSIVSDSYELFLADVLAGRNIEAERLRSLADGRIYTGKQAYENGLVDDLGNLDLAIKQAIDLAQISDPTVLEYSLHGWWGSFLGSRSQDGSIMSQFSSLLLDLNAGLGRKAGIYYLWL